MHQNCMTSDKVLQMSFVTVWEKKTYLCSCRYVQTMFCVCLNAYLYNLHGLLWDLWLLIQFNIIFSHLRQFNSTHFYDTSFRIIFKLREREFATTSYLIKLNSIRHFNLRNGEGVGPTRTLFRHPSGKRFKWSRPDPPPKCKRPEHLRRYSIVVSWESMDNIECLWTFYW